MSGGNSFLQDETQKTPEERITALEQMLPVYIQRVQAYDRMLEECRTLRDKLNEVYAECRRHSENLDTTKSILQQHHQDLENTKSSSSKETNTLNLCVKDLEKKLIDLQKSHESDKKSNQINIDSVKNNINETAKKHTISFAETTKLLSTLEVENKILLRTTQKYQEIFQYFQSQIDSHASDLRIAHQTNELLKDEIQKIRDYLKSVEINQQSLSSSLSEITKNSLTNSKIYCDSKSEELKKALLESPSTISNVKQEIAAKLEQVALDGSNAVLKASNCDKQIQIIERKLENIYLLLKKHELSK